MKVFIPFFVVLFSYYLEIVLSNHNHTEDGRTENYNLAEVFPSETKTFEVTIPPQNDYLQNISIQDVLSSDVDASEKIEKKIINVFTQYASDCSAYTKTDLSIEGFTFSKSSITVDLDSVKAKFHNVRIVELLQNSSKRNLYSTSIACNSTGMTKIEVKVPKNLEITADITVFQITNSTSGFSLEPEILNTGSISLTLKHNSISKQFITQPDDTHNTTSKIFYSKSMLSLDIDTKFQMAIYNKVQTFFDEVESSLRQFLIRQLDVKFNCSKFMNTDKNTKKINLPFFNSKLNNLYVIPNSKLEMWKGVSLSAGPILIDGLSSFNNTEFITLEKEVSSLNTSDGIYFLTTPRYDDPETKEITVKIKTNDLKGKVDWSYNSKQRSISFILEFIQFEVKKIITYEYKNVHNYYEYRHDRRDRYERTSNNNNVNVTVYLGNIQINSSKASICENESEFVNFVLSEYLKTVIADSLKNSLDKKIRNEFSFDGCNEKIYV